MGLIDIVLINLNAEIVACSIIQKIAPQAKSGKQFQIWFSPDLGGENGGVLSMRMQVILDSSFARPGSAPIWGGKKGEFRDWTRTSLISNKPNDYEKCARGPYPHTAQKQINNIGSVQRRFSIYTLSDLGVLSNLIGSLSLANEHYSPPTE